MDAVLTAVETGPELLWQCGCIMLVRAKHCILLMLTIRKIPFNVLQQHVYWYSLVKLFHRAQCMCKFANYMARLPSRRVATKLNHSQGDHCACAHSRLKYDATESINSNNAIKLEKKKKTINTFTLTRMLFMSHSIATKCPHLTRCVPDGKCGDLNKSKTKQNNNENEGKLLKEIS